MRLGTHKAIEAAFDKAGMGPVWAEELAPIVAAAAIEPYQPTLSVYSRYADHWFTVRYLAVGVKAHENDRFADEARVEFYDANYANDGRFYLGVGQFTGGRFGVDGKYGLLDSVQGYGLDLNGNQRAWTVDAEAMALVVEWLRHVHRSPAPGATGSGVTTLAAR